MARTTLPAPPDRASQATFKMSCWTCAVRRLCLPMGLAQHEVEQVEQLVQARRPVPRNHALFKAGDRFDAVFIVRTGFFKTAALAEDGREQVTGFPMAGELLGQAGIFGGVHVGNAVALEDSQVCVLPYEQLERLSRTLESLQHQFHRLLSRGIIRDQNILLLGSMRAEQRVAAFLLNLMRRLRARGFSSSSAILRMTREEIGSYLGLSLETVSRTFSRLQDDGLLTVSGREVRLLKPRQLLGLLRTETGQG